MVIYISRHFISSHRVGSSRPRWETVWLSFNFQVSNEAGRKTRLNTALDVMFHFKPKRERWRVDVTDLPGVSVSLTDRREESKDVGREWEEDEDTRHVEHCTPSKEKTQKDFKDFWKDKTSHLKDSKNTRFEILWKNTILRPAEAFEVLKPRTQGV